MTNFSVGATGTDDGQAGPMPTTPMPSTSRVSTTNPPTTNPPTPSRGQAIRIRGLRKTYGDRAAVDGVDLDVHTGEVFALLGPNGAGKTTTVEILEGYRRRDVGEVAVLGTDPAQGGRDWRARLGIVLQSSVENAELTVAEMVSHFGRYYPDPRDPDEVIAAVGLLDKRKARTRALSGGQRRRLDVALGIVGRPGAALPRRAHHGVRPAGPALVLGAGPIPTRRRHDHPAHHALPRRGRAARRPGRGDQPRAG